MDKIHDIYGLRLIVDNEEDCYKALNVVHHIWSGVPGKLKDYISRPKFNGYVDSGMAVVHSVYLHINIYFFIHIHILFI